MALAIATNNAALNAAASASSVNRDMETSMARLSTGKRINSASDDAAGVAISSRLSAEIRGTDQAIRNSLDGQALINTAEGAHKEIENILQRMREVSVQAANDTNNDQDRANLQAEMDAMVTEIDRIASTTTWAGANLMDASAGTTFSFQVGAATGSANQINIKINAMSAKALGVRNNDIKYMADPSVTTPVPVGAEFLINTTTEGNQYGPSVTALSDGGFVATWPGNDPGDGSGVIGQRFDASGVASGSEFLINTTTEYSQYGPSVTALSDGGFVATWEGKGPGDSIGVTGQRFDASGVASGSEFQINTTTAGLQSSPSVTALSDGGFVATWYGNGPGDNDGVIGQRFDASGVASGSEFQINTTTAGHQNKPSVTALSDGGFVATWHGDGPSDNDGIIGQRFDASGVASGSEFQINTTTAGDQNEPSVTALSDGGFVATWEGKGPSDNDGVFDQDGIIGQRFDASGVASGSEFQINTTTAGDQIKPSVTALSDGGFVATWEGKGPGDAYGIIGQRFDASGVASGSEFQINTTTAGFQASTSVTALSDGGFVATWYGNGPGDDFGVIGQRFDAGITNVPGEVMVTDAASSRISITVIDGAIQTVNIQRSKLGAVSNRLSHTVNNLTNISSNLSAAKGGIEDADFAKETTDLAKKQILQQVSTAMLAQANASKQNVLSLLQG